MSLTMTLFVWAHACPFSYGSCYLRTICGHSNRDTIHPLVSAAVDDATCAYLADGFCLAKRHPRKPRARFTAH
jgi:hypothetical protein